MSVQLDRRAEELRLRVVRRAMRHDSAPKHVAGKASFIDDIREPEGLLHIAVGGAPVAAGQLLGVDLEKVRAAPGVVAVLTAKDLAEVAPLSWMASTTARSRSPGSTGGGRKASRVEISAISFAASSARPPFSNCSAESRRCLMSDMMTCWASASSSGRPFSTSRFVNAAFAIRNGTSRAWSFARIPATMPLLISSINAITDSCEPESWWPEADYEGPSVPRAWIALSYTAR